MNYDALFEYIRFSNNLPFVTNNTRKYFDF